MSNTSKSISLSRQSTPKQQIPTRQGKNGSTETRHHQKNSESLDSLILNLESVLRRGQNTQISPKSSNFFYNNPHTNTYTTNTPLISERNPSTYSRATPSACLNPIRTDCSDISSYSHGIENIRADFSKQCQNFVSSLQRSSRKELENRYFSLLSEVQQTENRISDLRQSNFRIRQEILSYKSVF